MRAPLLIALLLAACTRKDDLSTPHAHGSTPIMANAVSAPTEPVEKAALALPTQAAPPRFVGRWVAEPQGGMRSAWPGTYVVGRFKGTRISARIRDDGFNLFQVVIDGEPKRVLRTDKGKGDTLYALAEGLPDGVHDVELHKRAEAKVGEVVFYGFEAATADGHVAPMLAPADPPARRIETLGDSITAGYGNEGPGAACGYVNGEQNEYATYGAIAARNVGADHVTIAWSGKTIHEMTEYFDKSLPTRPDGPLWDFAQYQPDAIVINLGTNNFANIDPGEKRFVGLYVDLVRKVRGAYPRAFVVCALGSMLSDVYPEKRHSLTQARKYMKTAVTKLKAEGDANLEFLEFPEQNHADGLGCGFHPSLKTHKLMADRLTALLKEHQGW